MARSTTTKHSGGDVKIYQADADGKNRDLLVDESEVFFSIMLKI